MTQTHRDRINVVAAALDHPDTTVTHIDSDPTIRGHLRLQGVDQDLRLYLTTPTVIKPGNLIAFANAAVEAETQFGVITLSKQQAHRVAEIFRHPFHEHRPKGKLLYKKTETVTRGDGRKVGLETPAEWIHTPKNTLCLVDKDDVELAEGPMEAGLDGIELDEPVVVLDADFQVTANPTEDRQVIPLHEPAIPCCGHLFDHVTIGYIEGSSVRAQKIGDDLTNSLSAILGD